MSYYIASHFYLLIWSFSLLISTISAVKGKNRWMSWLQTANLCMNGSWGTLLSFTVRWTIPDMKLLHKTGENTTSRVLRKQFCGFSFLLERTAEMPKVDKPGQRLAGPNIFLWCCFPLARWVFACEGGGGWSNSAETLNVFLFLEDLQWKIVALLLLIKSPL